MVIVERIPAPTGNIWYLAYGSNLSSSKFIKDRGINPLASVIVRVPGFGLSMDTAGLPYREPSFANIRPLCRATPGNGKASHETWDEKTKQRSQVTLLGTCYLITPEQYQHVLASEGGGIAYREVELAVEPIENTATLNLNMEGGSPRRQIARTLISVIARHPTPRPSHRYMDLIVNGAAEYGYPQAYQRYLQALPCYELPKTGRQRLGATLFLAIWVPVFALMEKITKASIALNKSDNGTAPWVVVVLVRSLMRVIWWHHDYLHAPFWGRGDGRLGGHEENKNLLSIDF